MRMEDFMFAFNDCDFSDRVLHLEIIPDDDDNSPTDSHKLKVEKYHEWFSFIQTPHNKDSESCDDDQVQTLHIESCDKVEVKTLHISSPILAARSSFFYNAFKSGIKESQQKNDMSFKLKASEHETLMDLLKFMYGNTLSATSSSDLVDVMVAASKLNVTSCMRHCVQLLLKIPMTLESALLYLDLPLSVLESEATKPLIDEAKRCVTSRYKDLTKVQDEFMDLPLSTIEAILGSENLEAISEDDVYDFTLKWALSRYPEVEKRREILTKRLARFIYFQNMSCAKLKEFQECSDFDHEEVSKLLVKALCSKFDMCCGQHIADLKDLANIGCGLSRRVYSPHCVVYFDIKKNEMRNLVTSIELNSQTFCLGGKRLYLMAKLNKANNLFGLFMVKAPETETCTASFEFAVMSKPSMEYQSKTKVNNHTFEKGVGYGIPNLLGVPWNELMSDNSVYFINETLHIRIELTLVKSKA